jgi:hypothetical protein
MPIDPFDPYAFIPGASAGVERDDYDPGDYEDRFPEHSEWFAPEYTGPSSPTINIPGAPGLDLPLFEAPTFAQATSDPGYEWRLQSGMDALQRSAAAKGVLRTGGTLADLVKFGQNFASNEYANVFNRALAGYSASNEARRAMFEPLLAQWQARANAEQAKGLAAFDLAQFLYGKRLDVAMQKEQWRQDQYNDPIPEMPD